MELRKIGIALSGGGMRATLFHLGVFHWLAEQGAMEQIKCISTVSGGSLCVGLIYAHNDLKWPTSEEFLTKVLPSIKETLAHNDLQASALLRLAVSPQYWHKKANLLARTMERKWSIRGDWSELDHRIKWYANCTTYENGKRFRFFLNDKGPDNMGDYVTGYVSEPHIPLAEVLAASAGFPVLIGPYGLDTGRYKGQWTAYPLFRSRWEPPKGAIHLWDGGVYDNLGLESIFNPTGGGKARNRLKCLIVSNASPSIQPQKRVRGFSFTGARRLLDISMDQGTALRTRVFMDYLTRTNGGMYLKIGNSAETIAIRSHCPPDLAAQLIQECLPGKQTDAAMYYKTRLSTPKAEDLELLLRHGYEVAKCTYLCYPK